MSHKRYRIAIVLVFVVIVLAGAAYEWIIPGLSSARTVPPKLEIAIATWLLHQSVPAAAKSSDQSSGVGCRRYRGRARPVQRELRNLPRL